MKIFLFFISFLAINCSDTGNITNQEIEKEALKKLEQKIIAFADKSVCSEEFTCAFTGFGSKPCGGNWSYLVYSSSIDTTTFLAKVDHYNTLEKEYNIKYGISSDCAIVSPPSSIICENKKCKAIYN